MLTRVALFVACIGVGLAVYLILWIITDCIEDVRWNKKHDL